MDFAALIPAIAAGKAGMAMSGIAQTAERAKSVAFSKPYKQDPVALFGPNTGSGFPESICIYQGSIFDRIAQKYYPHAKLLFYNTMPDVRAALLAKKCDAAFQNESYKIGFIGNDPRIVMLNPAIEPMSVAAGFHKDSTAILQSFNQFLDSLKASGMLDSLVKAWTTHPESVPMPALEVNADAPTLRMGATTLDPPFGFVRNEKVVGLDVELATRFAASRNMKLQVVSMDFAALIPALVSGKVDLILNGIFVTEERAQSIAFSHDYMQDPVAMFGLAGDTSEAEPSIVSRIASSIVQGFENNLLKEKRYLLILDGLKVTCLITVSAALLGTLMGALLCFVRTRKNRFLVGAAKAYISLVQGIPMLVLLMFLFYVLLAPVNLNGVAVAIIAIAINFSAYTAEMFRSTIESIPVGQTEAGLAMGFSRVGTFVNIVLPQVVRRVAPVYRGEFINELKLTSVVGYIAVEDLTKAGDIIRSRTFDAFFPLVVVAILYFALAWLSAKGLDKLSRIGAR
jgi:polar amino acid transport system substrate-binding protein